MSDNQDNDNGDNEHGNVYDTDNDGATDICGGGGAL